MPDGSQAALGWGWGWGWQGLLADFWPRSGRHEAGSPSQPQPLPLQKNRPDQPAPGVLWQRRLKVGPIDSEAVNVADRLLYARQRPGLRPAVRNTPGFSRVRVADAVGAPLRLKAKLCQAAVIWR